MSIIGHGVDIVECKRIQELMDRHKERFLERIFTATELEYCLGRKRELEHLSGRFAAKEAVLKVLGTGWRDGIRWDDIEVINDDLGCPKVTLKGKCGEIAGQLKITRVLISISHIETHAVASAIAVSEPS